MYVPPAPTSLPARFIATAALHPGRLAVSTASARWTYADLHHQAATLASHLITDSTAPIALLLDHDAPLIAAILAVLMTGRPYVALDAHASPARNRAVYAAATATLLITDDAHAAQATAIAGTSLILNVHRLPEAEPTALTPVPLVSPDAPACLLFTSGTTGDPKGVCLTHAALLHHNRNYTAAASLTRDDRLSLLTSPHLAASASALWGALLNGGALLPFDLRRHGTHALRAWLPAQALTVLHLVPSAFRALASIIREGADDDALATLRLLRLGGEPVLPSDLALLTRHARPGSSLLVSYSSTETGVTAIALYPHGAPIPPRLAGGPQGRSASSSLPLGSPLPAMRVTITDDHGAPLPDGHPGRITVTSPHLAHSYWNDPARTAAAFRPHPTDPTLRTFDTGDLGYLLRNTLHHLGRADDRLKIRGHRVHPVEVEAALCALPTVREAAVLAQGADADELHLVAHVVTTATPESLRAAIADSLPPHMVPAQVVAHDTLPRTPTGKLDRSALASAALARTAATASAKPHAFRSPLESRIATIWQEILARPVAAPSDDLFATLGASSLQSARIAARLEQELARRVQLVDLFDHPSVPRLAAHLARADAAPPTESPVRLVQVGDAGVTPLFFFHGDVFGAGLYTHAIARRLGRHRPVYAVAPLGVHTWPPPPTLQATAAAYLPDLRRTRPAGPYLLAGYCNGGLVAYELAVQLRAAGEPIHLLALIDAAPRPPRWPGAHHLVNALASTLRLTADTRTTLITRLDDHLRRWRFAADRGPRARLDHLVTLARSFANRRTATAPADAPALLPPVGDARPHAVLSALRRAMARYTPSPYPAPILTLWPAQQPAALTRAALAAWQRAAAEVHAHPIPGDHAHCVFHDDAIAAHLLAHLSAVPR